MTYHRLLRFVVLLVICFMAPSGARAQVKALDGITFAGKPDALFVDARKTAEALGWSVRWEEAEKKLFVNERAVVSSPIKRLWDGTALLAVSSLPLLGADVAWEKPGRTATLKSGSRSVPVARGAKRVEVSVANQRLRAYQGGSLVLETPVSTGRAGHRTPTGAFTAGPIKARMHRSGLYNGAAMPYSVQVNGNIFIHGFGSVPRYPASHGCIRVPLDNGNPARWFYEWVDRGTPVRIEGERR